MDFVYIPAFMFSLYIIDKFIKKDNIRWFVLHTITNLLVIISAFPDMFNIFINPLYINNIGSIYPRIFTIGLHAYHIVAFKKIEFIDYVHHILMIGALFTTYYYEDLNLTNYFLFYMTGLTGMLDYFMLVLVKLNLIHKITEKDVNSKLNNYIRYPLIMHGMSTLYFRYFSNLYDTSLYPILGLLLVFFWNGSYFNYRVIENYGKSRQELDNVHEV